MNICWGISWAAGVYGTFKQNVFEDKTKTRFTIKPPCAHDNAFPWCTTDVLASAALKHRTLNSATHSLLCASKNVCSACASLLPSYAVMLWSPVFNSTTKPKLPEESWGGCMAPWPVSDGFCLCPYLLFSPFMLFSQVRLLAIILLLDVKDFVPGPDCVQWFLLCVLCSNWWFSSSVSGLKSVSALFSYTAFLTLKISSSSKPD